MSDGVSLASGSPRTAWAMVVAERALLVAGIVLFIVLLVRIGAAVVWDNLRLVGWGFAPVLGQEAVAFIANTIGWYWAFPPPRPAIPFRKLFAARVGGEAINNLTPTATIGGEVVRARMLEGLVDMNSAWASVAIAKLGQTFSQIVFIAGGLVVVLQTTPLPPAFRGGLLIGLAVFAASVVVAIAMQRRGLFSAAARLAERLGVRVPVRLREQLRLLDDEIARFYDAPLAFLASVGGFFVGWCMGVVEIWLVLHFLGIEPSWTRALAIEVLSVAIDALLFFVPAKAGTQEGGKVLIFSLLGLDPAKGLVLGIVRRIRELAWSLIGLAILARHQARRGEWAS